MSMNRDKQFAPLLPKEEVEKQRLYSEPPQAPRPGNDAPYDHNKIKRLWIAVTLLAVLAMGLAGTLLYFLIPQPGETLDIQMYAVKMDQYGKVKQTGQVTFAGEFTHYRGWEYDRFALSECILTDKEHTSGQLRSWDGLDDGRILLDGNGLLIEIGPDKDWCVIRSGDVHYNNDYYVCSIHEDFDPPGHLADEQHHPITTEI